MLKNVGGPCRPLCHESALSDLALSSLERQYGCCHMFCELVPPVW